MNESDELCNLVLRRVAVKSRLTLRLYRGTKDVTKSAERLDLHVNCCQCRKLIVAAPGAAYSPLLNSLFIEFGINTKKYKKVW